MDDSIRSATRADYDALNIVFAEVELLHRTALPYWFRAVDGPALEREFFESQLDDAEAMWLVAERDGEIVGFVNVCVRQTPDRPFLVPHRYAHIENLAVRASSRGAGVGRALMAAAASWAVERGLSEIELNVWEFNQQALGFYEQLGYVTERRTMRRVISNVNS